MDTVLTPFAVYCSDCNVLMPTGSSAYKVDGCTFKHITCPKSPLKTFAIHKYDDTGVHIGL